MMSPAVSINAGGPSAGPLLSRPAIPSGDRPAHTLDEGYN